jgi:hypothetical protein
MAKKKCEIKKGPKKDIKKGEKKKKRGKKGPKKNLLLGDTGPRARAPLSVHRDSVGLVCV